MGTIFPLISDVALKPEDPTYYTECQVCAAPNVPLYEAQGCLIREDGTVDEDYDVYVACEMCLKACRIEHIDEYYLNDFVANHVHDVEATLRLL